MKVYNPALSEGLRPRLREALATCRALRSFNPKAHAQDKATRLNSYLRAFGLRSVVVAVSGGIDSAVVLGLAARAAVAEGSPLERIVPVLLPVHDETAATGQPEATARGREVCAAHGLTPVELDLTCAHAQLAAHVEAACGMAGQGWARGQLVAYQRTPALYYLTSLLAEAGTPGVLLGTTNKDEGAYLGYFGKASDGLVDVQLISDLHKSEVRSLAAELGTPASVLDVTPTGDMFDGRTDEQVFGAPYDFVELFLHAKKGALAGQTAQWDDLDVAQFEQLSSNLETLHQYNRHKYLGKSPAVHLDVLAAQVPGGWDYFVWR